METKMRILKLSILLAALLGAVTPVSAQFGGCLGACGTVAFSAPSYQGPGDTFSTSVVGAYSCAEAYTAAYASGGGNACDLVDSAAPTTVICTLKFLATGKVDLASASCTGSVTPATKCAAATGGVCNISKVYDQSGNGRDMIQVTAANQPTLLLSSTPTSTLPAINCGTAASNISLQIAGTITQGMPFTMFAVMIRTSDFTSTGGAMGGILGSNIQGIGSGSSANTVTMSNGNVTSAAATDSVWHAVGGLANGASGAINVDGSDSTVNTGVNSFSAAAFRLCRGNSAQYPGRIAEAIFYGATTTSTDRGNLSTNAHSSGRYNF
jgi:hypothetical protein